MDKQSAKELLEMIGQHNAVMSDRSRGSWHEGDERAHDIVGALFESLMRQAEAEGWYEEAEAAIDGEVAKYAASRGLSPLWVSRMSLGGVIDEDDDTRRCSVCCEPVTKGFCIDAGADYACESCFKAFMDRLFDEAWRETPGDEENAVGGYYDAYDYAKGVWIPLDIYWTEWEE